MTTITVDAALSEKLLAAVGGAEIWDEQGRRLGRFIFEFDPAAFVIPELDLTQEELARRLSPDAKTHTTAEVLDYLRKLK